MSGTSESRIVFEVETSRVLEILSKEIYDSPLALLRENVQNAYDAILMRCALENRSLQDGAIEVEVGTGLVTIADNGIGMTEEVLRNNFWKAGASGKRNDLAYRSGVIGTFGIGAMANFGVATVVTVETRAVESAETLVSVAERSKLSIAKECIDLHRSRDDRPPGTKVSVQLDSDCPLTVDAAKSYLHPYVRFLPVAVRLNGAVISRESLTSRFDEKSKGCEALPGRQGRLGIYTAFVEPFVDGSGMILARVHSVAFGGETIQGELALAQQGGQLMGLRNHFGLAPAPVSGHYQFGGIVDLAILQPTAGREALSRESIEHVHRLIALVEATVSEVISDIPKVADRNVAFLQYVLASGPVELAKNVTVEVLPEKQGITLGKVVEHCAGKKCHYYSGRDPAILQTFASEESYLLNVSDAKPRRQLQLQYIRRLNVPEVPDRATVTKEYSGVELSFAEAALVVRTAATLAEDYLLPNVEIRFADISHGVTILVEKPSDTIVLYLAKDSAAIKPVVQCYRSAYEVFGGFVKDFVRSHLYNRIAQYVPSTTKEGADALYKILQRNRELYRYEESELGDLEPLLADWLSGNTTLGEAIKTARRATRPQTDTVRSDQVGRVEQELPGVVDSPTGVDASASAQGREYDPSPPIMRPEVSSSMKILAVGGKYAQLNGFELFLGLSDRVFKIEGDFFREPHTTRVIWASHRVIYIFGHASTKLTLYYDIELKEPVSEATANGMMIPTTTLFTKNRIFVPVPEQLVADFKIIQGAKEFFVRFDTLMG